MMSQTCVAIWQYPIHQHSDQQGDRFGVASGSKAEEEPPVYDPDGKTVPLQ